MDKGKNVYVVLTAVDPKRPEPNRYFIPAETIEVALAQARKVVSQEIMSITLAVGGIIVWQEASQ